MAVPRAGTIEAYSAFTVIYITSIGIKMSPLKMD